MRDTTPEVAAVQVEVLRRLSGAQRLALALEMSVLTRQLAAARLQREHPEWSDREISLELLRQASPSGSLPVPRP